MHQEYGRRLLDRMADELKELAIIERTPLVEGRNMVMILSPLNKKHARGEQRADRRTREVSIAAEITPVSSEPEASSNAEDQNP